MKTIFVADASHHALIYLVAITQGFQFGKPRKVGDQWHFPVSQPGWDTLGNAPYHPRDGWLANVPDYLKWEHGGPILNQMRSRGDLLIAQTEGKTQATLIRGPAAWTLTKQTDDLLDVAMRVWVNYYYLGQKRAQVPEELS